MWDITSMVREMKIKKAIEYVDQEIEKKNQ